MKIMKYSQELLSILLCCKNLQEIFGTLKKRSHTKNHQTQKNSTHDQKLKKKIAGGDQIQAEQRKLTSTIPTVQLKKQLITLHEQRQFQRTLRTQDPFPTKIKGKTKYLYG